MAKKNCGMRNDEGKLRIELLPAEWILGLAEVMTAGVEHYAERNWELGMPWSKMVGCASRHLFKFICGQRYDTGPKGTGCHHLLCVAWNILALFSYDMRGLGTDDIRIVDMDLIGKLRVDVKS